MFGGRPHFAGAVRASRPRQRLLILRTKTNPTGRWHVLEELSLSGLPMRLLIIHVCCFLFPLLGGHPRPAPGSAPAPSDEANVLAAMTALRQALAAGDSARAQAAFTRSAWILDESERPLHHRPVRQSGCRGWCRPGPPLTHYQLAVLPDSATALAVETYRYGTPVASRRVRGQQYTTVSVLCRQEGRWLISSQTQYREALP